MPRSAPPSTSATACARRPSWTGCRAPRPTPAVSRSRPRPSSTAFVAPPRVGLSPHRAFGLARRRLPGSDCVGARPSETPRVSIGRRYMASISAAGASASVSPAARTSLPTVFAFGSMGVPLAALAVVAGVYLPRYYVSLGLSFLAVAAAISLVRFIDIVFDPLVSLAMDRTKTPIGRYRPWLIVGAPIVMLGTWMLTAPQGFFTTHYLILWSLVLAAGSSMVLLGLAAW